MSSYDETGLLLPCVAVSDHGKACEKDSYRTAPFPLCFDHAFLVYMSMHGEVTRNLRIIHERMEVVEKGPSLEALAMQRAYDAQSVVYYIRIGDYIKIGFTTNMTERIKSLRVDATDIMATEPGGRAKERERHEQFADIRRGRKENFERTPELLTHIARVRREQGKPRITTYPVINIPAKRALFSRPR